MNQGKGVRLGIDVVWLALLSLYIVAGAALVPFHGDESSKIYVGRDYYYLFLEGDLGKIAHQAKRSSASGEYRANLASGSISNMIYGWLAASSGYAIEDLNDDWHWGQDYAFNLESNRVPDTRLLRSARLASAAQLAAATALLFAFARITVNRPTSFIASLLFAVHPIVLLNGRRAMQEGSHMLGMMLVLVVAAWLIRQRQWWQYALLGACAGLAIAAKHTSFFVVAIVFLVIAGLSLYESMRRSSETRDRRVTRWLAGLVASGLVMLLVFYLLNPGWWSAPIATATDVMSERAELLQRQVGVYGGYQTAGQQVNGFFRFVFLGERQYFEDKQWSEYAEISEQIQIYEKLGMGGRNHRRQCDRGTGHAGACMRRRDSGRSRSRYHYPKSRPVTGLGLWHCGHCIRADAPALGTLLSAGIAVRNDYGCSQLDNHDEMDMAARRNMRRR